MTLTTLSSHALVAALGDLVATERRTIVAFVLHLAELERRQLHLEMGYPSIYAFCADHLKLTEASAYRRMVASRLVTRYPIIADYLRDGRLSLTTLEMLKKVLTDENHQQILDRAAGKTKDEVEALLAVVAPQPEKPDLFRRLPSPQLTFTSEVANFASAMPTEPASPAPAGGALAEAVPPACAAAAPAAPRAEPRPTINPVAPGRHLLRLTVDQAFVDDLERLKALLSHVVPDGNLTRLLHEAIRRTATAHEKRRRGSDKPHPRKNRPAVPSLDTATALSDDDIPTEVKRVAWVRDEACCAYVSPDGKRCGSTYKLQFHHIHPAARGGPPTVENISLRCEAHNQYHAEKDFGRDFMRTARGRAQSM